MDDDDFDTGDLSGDGSDLFDSLGSSLGSDGSGLLGDLGSAAAGALPSILGATPAATTAAPISSSTILIFGGIAIVALLAVG